MTEETLQLTAGQPKASIIVPVYNTAPWLGCCIDALVHQTERNIEVLLIDDGSTDGCPAMLDEAAAQDARLRVFHRENGGVSQARNFGLDQARGEFVLFVDSDDYIALTMVEKLVSIADNTESDIVVFGGRTFPTVPWIDRCLAPLNHVVNNGFDALLHHVGSYPLMCNKLYRRSLIESAHLRFSTDLALGEDNVFQFSIFPHARRVAFCQDELYFYRCEREGSAMTTMYVDKPNKVRRHLEVVRHVLAYWQSCGFISGHVQDLAAWMADFLYDDAKDLPFDERLAFAEEVHLTCDAYGLSGFAVPAGPDATPQQAMLDFLLNPARALTELPQLSIICLAHAGQENRRECFLRLANQFDCRVQLLLVAQDSDVHALADVADFAEHDVRAEVVQAGPDGWVAPALAAARASWVLFANLNDTYEYTLVTKVTETAGAVLNADLITFRDLFHVLRLHTTDRLLKRYEATTAESEGSALPQRSWYAPQDCPDRLFNYCSLSAANKVFARDFLVQNNVDAIDECTVGRLLLACKVIAPANDHLVHIETYDSAGITQARGTYERLLEALGHLKEHLRQQGLMQTYEQTFTNAALACMLAHLEIFRAEQASEACFELFREHLEDITAFMSHDVGYFYERADYDDTLLAQTTPAKDFFALRDGARLAGLERYVRDLEARCKYYDDELVRFRTSISFRVGRAVTAPARAARDMLTRLRGGVK